MNRLTKIFSLSLILLLSNQIAYSNDKEQAIDSLKLVIESEAHDTLKIDAYQNWDNLIYFKDPALDQELNFKITTICADNLNKQLHPKEELFFKATQSKAFNNLALIFKAKGSLNEALDYHNKSLLIKRELKDRKGEALLLMNVGSIYHIQGDLIQALKYYYESLKIWEELNDLKGKAGIYNNIGAIYHYQKHYQDAIKYYSESLKIRQEMNDFLKVAASYGNIGLVYFEQGDSLEANNLVTAAHEKYDLALEQHIKCLSIFKEHENLNGLGVAYNNIGAVYYKKKKLDIALDYFKLSLDIKKQLNNNAEMASAIANIANIYFDKGLFSEATKLGEEAFKMATEANSIVEINSSAHILYKIYKETGKPSLALKYHEAYLSSKDSLQNNENNKLTLQQEFKYEYEKKATADSIVQAEELKVKNAEIAAQNAQSEKDQLVIKRQREQKYYLFGGIGLVALFSLFMINRVIFINRQKKVIENQKHEVESQKNQIEHQHHQLEETHKEISDSIKYAKRLQTAILPELEDLNRELKKGFVLFEPKDVVSGDFYWMQKLSNGVLFAAADCTGHGVPGAMVSVVCSNALNRAVKEFNCTEPAQILDKTRELVIETFEGSSSEIKDGMDIALCKLIYHQEGADLIFAGANNPLWILRSGAQEMEEIKGSKQPIGKYETDHPFIQHTTKLSFGDSIYIFSDGYADQFGGEKGKKFKYKTLKDCLIQYQTLPMDDQKEKLAEIFNAWRGDFEQVDDVTLIGVQV